MPTAFGNFIGEIMEKGIRHFMWGYQKHFKCSMECRSKDLFLSMDSKFDPEIFLVGILDDEQGERFLSCVEPEDDYWIQSEDFNNVKDIAKGIRNQYPENSMILSHPIAQKRHDESLTRKSIRDAIKSIVNTFIDKPNNMQYFVSIPTMVDCYFVSVVLGLQEDILKSYYHLGKDSVKFHECRNKELLISFIDAVIVEFLNKVSEELKRPDAGCNPISFNLEELLRSAGNSLMSNIAYKVDDNCIYGIPNLFRTCNEISSLYYERSEGNGKLILARKDHPAVNKIVIFASPYELNNHRGSRKLLELGNKDQGPYLHCDSEKIYALATIENTNIEDEDLYHLNIIGHYHWILQYNGHDLMGVRYGQPYLPRPSIIIEKLKVDLPRIFNKIKGDDIEKLIILVKEASNERHGTMLVISEKAQEEALRLKNQSIPLIPCFLNKEILPSLTPIDGAIILSPDGICHAIGVILDGKASQNGDSSRGARYNSALRYIESAKEQCIAIIVSEDGDIDLMPDLRPPIKSQDILDVIEKLSKFSIDDKINHRLYSEMWNWLEKHRFYLLKNHCDLINETVKIIEEKLDKEEPGRLKFIRSKFEPNKEMIESLYFI